MVFKSTAEFNLTFFIFFATACGLVASKLIRYCKNSDNEKSFECKLERFGKENYLLIIILMAGILWICSAVGQHKAKAQAKNARPEDVIETNAPIKPEDFDDKKSMIIGSTINVLKKLNKEKTLSTVKVIALL